MSRPFRMRRPIIWRRARKNGHVSEVNKLPGHKQGAFMTIDRLCFLDELETDQKLASLSNVKKESTDVQQMFDKVCEPAPSSVAPATKKNKAQRKLAAF